MSNKDMQRQKNLISKLQIYEQIFSHEHPTIHIITLTSKVN